MRQVIFISHANPQDNEFTTWLASRLQLLGYQVWCDVKGLIGGEKQWEVIDNVIRNESIKFLLVVSKDLCVKPGQLKDGISKEFHLAESIAKKLGTDYIIPLKIDEDSSYDDFIGLNRYNHIQFTDNWAEGLKSLIKKLEKDNVAKIEISENKMLTDWYENEFTTKFGLINKSENYFTNIWPIEEIWETFDIYLYESESLAEEIRVLNTNIPVVRHGNTIATFGDAQLTIVQDSAMGSYEKTFIDKFTINVLDVIKNNYLSDTFPTKVDCENLLKRLLMRAFHLTMREKGLYWFELSSKRLCYFYPKGRKDKISFYYGDRKKTKNLLGSFKEAYWHFGITSKVTFSPFFGYVLKSHILFSDDGYKIWESKERLHKARRRKGRSWFNEEWRDQLFAYINSLKNPDGKIEIKLNEECNIEMLNKTYQLSSSIGYIEPNTKDRQNVLIEDSEDESEIIIKEEETDDD